MFLIDDLLAAPFKGVMWILKEVVAAAEEEQAAESDRIKDRLREMYMLLETGQMTEAEFEAEESELLDRLDELEQAGAAAEGEDEEDAEEEDVDAQDAEEDNDHPEAGQRYAAAPERDAAGAVPTRAEAASAKEQPQSVGIGSAAPQSHTGKSDDDD